jgi:hypothetical protein
MGLLLDAFTPKVTDQMNCALSRNFLAKDVEASLFQMVPSKAPRVAVGINDTAISLVPEVHNSQYNYYT